MTISERLMSLLKMTGNTQKSIAELLHIQPSTVNTWIKSNSDNIPSSYIMPICRYFCICPEELLEGTPDNRVALSDSEKKMLALYRNLSPDSQIIVMASAISESRLNKNE